MEWKLKATSAIDTARARRLAKQFVSHWAHHTDDIERGEDRTIMRFPREGEWAANTVQVETSAELLTITVWTDDEGALKENCESIAEHLHRFAGRRETLTIDWVR